MTTYTVRQSAYIYKEGFTVYKHVKAKAVDTITCTQVLWRCVCLYYFSANYKKAFCFDNTWTWNPCLLFCSHPCWLTTIKSLYAHLVYVYLISFKLPRCTNRQQQVYCSIIAYGGIHYVLVRVRNV